MSDANINMFPKSRQEALAFLHVQNQDLKGKSPEDLAKLYVDAYERIGNRLKEIRKERSKESTSFPLSPISPKVP